MDSSLVTATAALAGSVVGASALIVATWISQRTQRIRASAEWKLREREVHTRNLSWKRRGLPLMPGCTRWKAFTIWRRYRES